jgi:hypothetical protein
MPSPTGGIHLDEDARPVPSRAALGGRNVSGVGEGSLNANGRLRA